MTRRALPFVCAIFLSVLTTVGRAQDVREELSRAEDYFAVADFPTALVKVDQLLGSGELRGDALADAWVLKARCELALGQRANARTAFCSALGARPSWRPDPAVFTSDELEVFAAALNDCGAPTTEPVLFAPSKVSTASTGAKPWWKKPLVLAAGGLAIAGGVLLLGGGDDAGATGPIDVPGFPDPPQ